MTCQQVMSHPNPGHDVGPPLQAGKLASSESSASEKAEDTGDRHAGFSHHLRSTSVHPGALGGFICALDDAVLDYDSAYDYASTSSFEFQKGERATVKSLVAPYLNKAAPSKWDDAEKWLVNQSPGEALMKGRTKSGPLYGHYLHAGAHAIKRSHQEWHLQPHSLKSGYDTQLASVLPNGAETLLLVHGSGHHQNVKLITAHPDQGFELPSERTKKMDVKKGPNFAFMPSPASPQKGSFYDCYPPIDEPVDMKEVSITHEGSFEDSPSKPTMRTRKPTSDSLASVAPFASPAPAIRSVSMRDMGTEMTPIASQEPSRTGTPLCATTPTLHSPVSSPPSTPRQGSPAARSPLRSTESAYTLDADGKYFKGMHTDLGREMQIIGAHTGGKVTLVPWASKEEEDADSSKLLKNIDLEEVKKNVLETRAVAWEEAEHSKFMARFKREEAKILAWENHEKAKAEAEMRRIEIPLLCLLLPDATLQLCVPCSLGDHRDGVALQGSTFGGRCCLLSDMRGCALSLHSTAIQVKVEKTRAHAHEGLLKKLAAARLKAEERLAAAEARRCEKASKSAQRADYIRRTGRLPSSSLFSCGLCR
ncbi:hypothetical protein GOP47_0000183 [Adiantum capillus-veneris]|uniref:Remorin C-terminal domain-containing protein n=1 Tax=Adiantum capillus-veneris TaxID=13818 RepID=A0A9D4VCV1_ADICA|nr:hypothetical protein GOP47_0000183 [Adiantum capillus-veneris]